MGGSNERKSQPPYKMQKALIDEKIVPCINVRPYVYNDHMMTLPDFVRYFSPNVEVEKCRHMLQDILKIVLYKGNTDHQVLLQREQKCIEFDPVPMVLVIDIMNRMSEIKDKIKNITTTEGRPEPPSKRAN